MCVCVYVYELNFVFYEFIFSEGASLSLVIRSIFSFLIDIVLEASLLDLKDEIWSSICQFQLAEFPGKKAKKGLKIMQADDGGNRCNSVFLRFSFFF